MDALSRTRVTYDEFDSFYKRLRETGMERFEKSIRYVHSLLKNDIPEVAFLVGKPVVLCQEVFTHKERVFSLARLFTAESDRQS